MVVTILRRTCPFAGGSALLGTRDPLSSVAVPGFVFMAHVQLPHVGSRGSDVDWKRI